MNKLQPTNAWRVLRTSATKLTILLLLAAPATAKAQYSYGVNNGALTITGYSGPGGAVVIPGSIYVPSAGQNLPVTAIGAYAFWGNNSLTCVTLPDTVTNLDKEAFMHCNGLVTINIPAHVAGIGAEAFFSCDALAAIDLPESVTSIGESAFNYCPSLSAITVAPLNPSYTSADGVLFNKDKTALIQYPGARAGGYTAPDSVIDVAISGFADAAGLTSVTFGTNVATLGDYAFQDCTGLTNVTLPDSLASIGQWAFDSCNSLTNVTLPRGLVTIGDSAFSGSANLAAINVDPLNSVFSSSDGVLFDKGQTKVLQCPLGRTGVYTIPDGVTEIADGAFYYCASLAGVNFPASLWHIGESAFCGCDSLTNLVVPEGVTTIDAWAFDSCFGLTNAVLPDSVISLGSSVFCYDGALISAKLPSGLISIPSYTFDLCGSLQNVTLPDTVTSIGYAAFYDCGSLTTLNLPRSLTDIGGYAFGGSSLTNVTIPAGVTSIGYRAFYGCAALKTVWFAGDAPSADTYAFNGTPATLYYLPTAANWCTPFVGRPAVLWNPKIQTAAANFGIRTNRLGFAISGTANVPIMVEACTNLSVWPLAWWLLQSCTLTNGSLYFCDPSWTNHTASLYRLRSP